MNYEKDLMIDGMALDKECLTQSSLMGRYCRILADAEREYDNAKENLEAVKSELEMDIRNFPSKYKVEKVTDAAVKATIPLQKEYKFAFKHFVETKYEFGMAKGAVKSIENREKSLENLVKLFGMHYFSGPSNPLEIDRDWVRKETIAESNASVKKMVRRNREE